MVSAADLRVSTRDTPPPEPKCLYFDAVFRKIGQIVCWHLLIWEILDPPLGVITLADPGFGQGGHKFFRDFAHVANQSGE